MDSDDAITFQEFKQALTDLTEWTLLGDLAFFAYSESAPFDSFALYHKQITSWCENAVNVSSWVELLGECPKEDWSKVKGEVLSVVRFHRAMITKRIKIYTKSQST